MFLSGAGIFKHSMGARNRVGIGLSYRPARLHRLAEFNLHKRFKIRASFSRQTRLYRLDEAARVARNFGNIVRHRL
jgi:hypothetical protein